MSAKKEEKLVLPMGAPSEKQRLFLRDTHRFVAYGGARGGGKSWVVRCKAVLLALRHPGIRLLILRRTYPELMNNHVDPLSALLAPAGIRYNRREHVFAFPNGSTLRMGYCAADGHTAQYQGAEFDVIFFDEATNFKEAWIERILPSVRGVNRFPKRAYFTCNPGGPGHSYIKRLFIDRNFRPGEDPRDYSFIRARVTDNEALMKSQPDYIETLRALSPRLRRAWMDGEWDVLEGQVFEEFRNDPEHYADRRFTHVIDPFPPDPGARILRGFDWGYNKPFSMGWYALDPDGVLFRIAEFYGCRENEPDTGLRMAPDEVFREAARIEREHPYLKGRRILGVADPAIWSAEYGNSIAAAAERHGLYFDRADNARIPGWMQCHRRLAFDENGYARFYVYRTCRSFIRTIPVLEYDPVRPEDVDTKGEDHIADEWRYVCMARPVPPRAAGPEAEYRFAPDPLDDGRRK